MPRVFPGDLVQHVLALMRTPPPGAEFVVPGSTPVFAFGDALRARVATLGINPSSSEFLTKNGQLIEPRRLATVRSLGLDRGGRPHEQHAAQLLLECITYFENEPYWKWFTPLEKLITAATSTSYAEGTACHLDLVPWATTPVWSKIPLKGVRDAYLDAGVPFISDLLHHLDLNLVLMNGKQVVTQVAATGLSQLEVVGSIPFGNHQTTSLYEGTGNGAHFLGWSSNIQGTPGANAAMLRADLAAWITERRRAYAISVATSDAGELTSAAALVAHLENWLATSDAPTIAPVGTFGGRQALAARIGATQVFLNADTKRAAIIELVETARADACVWQVVAGASGKANKVVFRRDRSSTPGWYCYTTHPAQVGLLED